MIGLGIGIGEEVSRITIQKFSLNMPINCSFCRGHRAESFFASDLNELVEIRARQRTFYGAYFRTALGNLGYALTILRLFDSRFYRSKYITLRFLVPPGSVSSSSITLNSNFHTNCSGNPFHLSFFAPLFSCYTGV